MGGEIKIENKNFHFMKLVHQIFMVDLLYTEHVLHKASCGAMGKCGTDYTPKNVTVTNAFMNITAPMCF